jgi:CTP synthase
MAVIEYARNVLGISEATTEENDKDSPHKVIIYMPEIDKHLMGGNMRLGAKTTSIVSEDTLASWVYYKNLSANERHRHRYEVNIEYKARLEAAGLSFSGEDSQKERMEIIEIKDHPFFLGVQYHPEFTSRPFSPNPCFYAFILASAGQFDRIGFKSDLELRYTPEI